MHDIMHINVCQHVHVRVTLSDMTDDELLDAIGPAFSKLRRSALLEVANPVSVKDLTRARVLDLVAHGGEVTVGSVAQHLAVDPSVASRMVSDCISAGYLVRAAAQQDGRRTVLQLSPAGAGMLDQFRRKQREAYEYITASWTEDERLELARLLLKYVEALADLRLRRP